MKIVTLVICVIGLFGMLGVNPSSGKNVFRSNFDPLPIIEKLEAGDVKVDTDVFELPLVKPIGFFTHRTDEGVFAHSFFYDGKNVYLSIYTRDGRIFSAVLIDTKKGVEKYYFHDSDLMKQFVEASGSKK